MAVYEQSALLRCKDENGNEYLLYPITKLDCVDGAEDLVHYDKDQELTAVQKAQFLKNIGGLCAPVSAQTNQFLKVSAVDDNGNVTAVETEEVQNEVSWDDIDDRPFGNLPTGSDTLRWDGNAEGLIQADGYTSYLISESTPTLADFENGASYTYLQNGEELSANLGMGTAIYEAGDGCIVVSNTTIALKDGATLGDVTYPKKGTYFTWIGNNAYTTSLTINGYNGFPSEKKLDAKWLPHHTHDLGPTPIVTSGTGEEYTVTIDGVTELYNGLQFIMLPHTNSTTTSVKLNVNGLGAKLIRQRLSTNTSIGAVGASDNWIVANKPVTVTYNGTAWVAELTRPDANNLYGTVKIQNGGTGASTVEAARENLNVYSKEEVDSIAMGGGSFEQVQSDWNQTDETAADFIKNKPFGEYEGLVDVLPLTQYDGFYLDSAFGVYAYTPSVIVELTIGKTYTVSWDGVEYVCVAQDANAIASGSVLIGNATNFGLSGNNEPFIIASVGGSVTQYYSLTDTEAGGCHSISIVGYDVIIEKIDSKYLTQSDWNENDATHASYIINRPFGITPLGTVIVPETSVNLTIPFDGIYYTPIKPVGFVENHSYSVEFDGINYTLPAVKDDTGGISVSYEDGTDCPFLIFDNFNGSGHSLVFSSMGEHTFKIALAEDVITKIDAKYLPDNIGSGSSLPEVTTSDAGKFLRVSAEGTWIVETIQDVSEVGL